jgi:hypothetical protein
MRPGHSVLLRDDLDGRRLCHVGDEDYALGQQGADLSSVSRPIVSMWPVVAGVNLRPIAMPTAS